MDVKITFDRYNVIEADKINDVKVVMVKGEKGDVGYPTDAQVETAVDEWLTAHPEVTTTVQDGSITIPKLADDVKNEFDKKADAIVKSASGEVASFTDGGNGLLVKTLNVSIVPKQSGSGDPSPSNVRPISGYSDVNVTRCGKNLFNPTLNSGLLGTNVGNNDTTVSPTTRYAYSEKVPTTSGCRFSFKSNDTNTFSWLCVMRYVDGIATEKLYNNEFDSTNLIQFYIPPVENSYIRAMFGAKTGYRVGDTLSGEVQVELGSTATAYEPYQGTSYPISLGQTVYGGTLEVMSGKLTIDKKLVTYDGSSDEPWGIEERPQSYVGANFYIRKPTDMNSAVSLAVINNMKLNILANSKIRGGYIQDGLMLTGYYNFIIGNMIGVSTVADFKTWLSTHNIQVLYPISTPTEITLTPTQVKTLLGNNNIFADSGSVEVEYRADTTLAYNELLSLIASLS